MSMSIEKICELRNTKNRLEALNNNLTRFIGDTKILNTIDLDFNYYYEGGKACTPTFMENMDIDIKRKILQSMNDVVSFELKQAQIAITNIENKLKD